MQNGSRGVLLLLIDHCCAGYTHPGLYWFLNYLSLISQPLFKDSFESLCMPRNVNLIYRFQISTGLVAQLLKSQVEPAGYGCQGVLWHPGHGEKRIFFCVFSSAFRFTLSHADGSQLDLGVLKNRFCKNRFRLKE